MTRIPMVGGNWKMHLDGRAAATLAGEIAAGAGGVEGSVDLAVFPPHPYLGVVSAAAGDSGVVTGGQDVSDEPSGAFTGQVAASMLVDSGCTMTLVGHSERRHGLGEDDVLLSRKVRTALDEGLRVLLCVGETLEQRDQGKTFDTVLGQVRGSLALVNTDDLACVDLAYEPVWAIGTGRTAGPAEAQEVHAALRSELGSRYDARSAARIRILYGGSVKPANAAELMACEDVDGALVGGASLQAESFLDIARAAARRE
ncbi:MAG: triose-phosphate isomerase [Phycisphaerales bacterium]|nr:triose-phosphate isomerase [Phycisphaerales bacterium]MDP6890008.1 triose-phosphate isomerase [Phycisphaerales bacterium]